MVRVVIFVGVIWEVFASRRHIYSVESSVSFVEWVHRCPPTTGGSSDISHAFALVANLRKL